jgi:hypothetical protein
VDSCFSVLSLYSKQKFIECVEEEVSGGYENVLAKESQITIKLPKDGQTTKLKYACKALLVRNWGLHPLIHTLLEFNLAQDVESIMKRSLINPLSSKDG